MTTLRELAKHLGLSPATVSRALNGFPEVGEKTRARVIEASLQYNYKPNLSAKRLATGKSGMVGIVFHSARDRGMDPHFVDFLAALSEALADSEIDLVVHISSPIDQLAHYRRFADGGLVDGMIISAPIPRDPRMALLKARGVAFVVHGRGEDDPDYAYYDIDNTGAFTLATQLLADLGHKRIAFTNGPKNNGFAIQRKAAFLAVMGDAGTAGAGAVPRARRDDRGQRLRPCLALARGAGGLAAHRIHLLLDAAGARGDARGGSGGARGRTRCFDHLA